MFDRKECPHISGTEQENETNRIKSFNAENKISQVTELTNKIKIAQEKYASALSKHQSIKTETIKRQD